MSAEEDWCDWLFFTLASNRCICQRCRRKYLKAARHTSSGVIAAYVSVTKYMQAKLPLCKQSYVFQLSTWKHKATFTYNHLKKLVKHFQTVINCSSETGQYLEEISKLQVDPTLPDPYITPAGRQRKKRLDHWWVEVFPRYPTLGKVMKACHSIFITN